MAVSRRTLHVLTWRAVAAARWTGLAELTWQGRAVVSRWLLSSLQPPTRAPSSPPPACPSPSTARLRTTCCTSSTGAAAARALLLLSCPSVRAHDACGGAHGSNRWGCCSSLLLLLLRCCHAGQTAVELLAVFAGCLHGRVYAVSKRWGACVILCRCWHAAVRVLTARIVDVVGQGITWAALRCRC